MASLRMQRVRELLKREIGEAIRREFPVSEVGLVTVNDVDVAGDQANFADRELTANSFADLALE